MTISNKKLLLPLAISMALYGPTTLAQESEEENNEDEAVPFSKKASRHGRHHKRHHGGGWRQAAARDMHILPGHLPFSHHLA